MNSFITPGTVAGVLSFLAVLASAFGKPALATWLQDPQTATEIIAIIGGLLAVYAGIAKGVKG